MKREEWLKLGMAKGWIKSDGSGVILTKEEVTWNNATKVQRFYFKCGCGYFVTNYPFVSCNKCGWAACGSTEDLEKRKKEGTLIQLVDPTDIPKDMKIMNELPHRADWKEDETEEAIDQLLRSATHF